jgi:hypothetical protein
MILALFAATLWRAQEAGRPAKENNMFASNELFAKGGIGIIDQDLYIALKSPRNELILRRGERWTGLDMSRTEAAIFFEGKVWPPGSLPDHFDLSKAVVISFENTKVRFFDFRNLSGGYYRRSGQR